MRRNCLRFAASFAMLATAGLAQQGPYKVLKTAKVGGAGGFDYIYADDAGRRLYIPRGAEQGPAPTPARVTVFDLDTLVPVGRDSQYQSKWRGGRSQIRPRFLQQQTGSDVGYQNVDPHQDH